MSTRLYGLDVFRGYGVFLMLIFHLFYDLNHFGYLNLDINNSWFWQTFRVIIVTIFLLTVGINLKLTHKNKFNPKSFIKRFFLLGISASLVSIATYIQFPQAWIYFGVLHFIWVASIIGVLLLRQVVWLWTILIISIVSMLFETHFLHSFYTILQKPFSLPQYTLDLVPLFPWLGIVLLGILMVHYTIYKRLFTHDLLILHTRINRFLSLLGKHALMIYLTHQPIIFLWFSLFENGLKNICLLPYIQTLTLSLYFG
ncbi:MAG: DUF1624 domain-containing protein [Epsilonproteobacteria bacterium]|nr:DUF1624 domain-containing protein [Campylobacterota bacterium]